jgi:outer membrane protein OmpA-like peptidoglycan-associated protein/tetratricopeptide (TPR) repeat protein
MNLRYLYLIIALTILVGKPGYGQANHRKLVKKARAALAKSDYENAKLLYSEALAIVPEVPDLNFELGLAYYNSNVEKGKSLDYFIKALTYSKEDTIPEMLFYLARSYHYVEDFENAIKYYNSFKAFTKSNDDGTMLARDVDRFIQMCNYGTQYNQDINSEIKVVNLGEQVNTQFAEYAPVVKKDENLLLFTARKRGSTGGKFYHDDKYFEDIYVSVRESDQAPWGWANKFDSASVYISSKVNTKGHDAAIAFSDDEKTLFIYRDNHVWLSEWNNGVWGEPVKMGKEINSKGHEPSAFLTADGNTLFIVSNRNEGFGGRDIYWTSKNGAGNWKPLRNLGPVINTRFDEDAPFFMKDGKTMYFSSNGHTTMGGYDVFKTILQSDSTWTVPENMGVPVNSAGDDIYFSPNEKGIWAYHSSSRNSGFGDMDIYRIQLECENLPNTEIKGKLVAGTTRKPLGGTIKITDSDGNDLGSFPVDPETGNYVLVLPPEKTYNLELFTPVNPWERERPHRETFFVPKQCEPYALYQEINMRHMVSETNKTYAQEALFMNAMFNAADSARAYYNIQAEGSPIRPEEAGLNLAGIVKFNDLLVAPGTEIYLLNARDEIVRISETYQDGTFAFNGLRSDEEYSVALNADGLRSIYYGISPNNADNGLIVKGTIQRIGVDGVTITEQVDSMDVYLVDNNKRIVNGTQTSIGKYLVDNVNVNAQEVKKLNELHTITYNLATDGMDFAVSAYIRTINEGDNTNYTEFIDLIPIDTSSISIPESMIAFENIYFDFDKFFLRDKSMEILDKIYNYMAANPQVTIQMDGHCDWMGTDEYNVGLSQNRAVSAFKYLTSRGISASRISRKWYGESQPAASNANPDGTDNPDGRQLNRRVEFKITTAEMQLTISTY